MAEGARDEVRYTAFLSYSHKDAAAAGKLHRRLESYRLPRRLVGKETPRGIVPARLWPIFRDRDELPAASDLSETVRTALAQSGALIILCSAHAAESLWVAEEIRVFRELHPDRPILAAILDGDPPACFPEALRAFGQDGTWHEPLATDLRRKADGAHLGLLKLVAGITGVGLDELVQRDAARRIRHVMAVTGAAVMAMLIMGALAVVALQARAEAERQSVEAERQRAEAEGQIEFMLTDLRARLRGVGRIDIMVAVNQHALDYYRRQNMAELGADSLERRARVLHAMGEDNMAGLNMATARSRFQEAHRTTGEQLARSPDDTARIFAHSQSEFYVGDFALEHRDYATARRAFEGYRDLANRLIAVNPRNAEWLRESGFAEGNVCTVLRVGFRQIREALAHCRTALARMEAAAQASGDPDSYRSNLANRHAELADTMWLAGQRRQALFERRRQLDFIEAALRDEPQNRELRARRLRALRGLANLQANLGLTASAVRNMTTVQEGMAEIAAHDPHRRALGEELRSIRAELQEIQDGRRH